MHLFSKVLLLQSILFSFSDSHGQQKLESLPFTDSVSLRLDSTEALFLRGNFLLLAQLYNVDAARAQVIQARLYPNPAFNFGSTIYNQDAKKVWPAPFSSRGEVNSGLSQLIILAGKRNKQVELARANVLLNQYQFFDLVRTLKYTLRTDFFNIFYLQQSAKVYDAEIKALSQIVNAFAEQGKKGYISEKEIIRIKAQLYSFKSEYNDLLNQIKDTESELRQVLQLKPTSYIIPVADTQAIRDWDPLKYQLTVLVDTAFRRRTDLIITRQNTAISELNYKYQKALAVPDVIANLSYDQQGSYVKNLTMAGISINLPFFNRNQGNIKAAKYGIDAATTTQKSVEHSVEENVYRALQKALDQDKLFKGIDTSFSADFERLMTEVLMQYQKRNITILEFLDFYDSYKQNALQVNNIQFNRVSAFEDINFFTAYNFFN